MSKREDKIKRLLELANGKNVFKSNRPLIWEEVPGHPELVREIRGKTLKKSELKDFLKSKKKLSIIWADMTGYDEPEKAVL